MKKQNIVTLGGGTWSLMLLTWLRAYADTCNVSTIMAMADDGGSTGRMREEFNMPAFGWDFRDALVWLAENESLAKVFTHRFQEWGELKGHSVGNIILLWLREASGGDIPTALDIAHDLLRVRGKVYPSTTEAIDLCCEYDDGTIIKSQTDIDNSRRMSGRNIINTRLEPQPSAYQKAIDVLLEADKIILWPGDLYSNVVANIIVDGIGDAIRQSNAQVIYICNLMTKYNQTHDFDATDFVDEVHKYLGAYPDIAIINNDLNPQWINTDQYAAENRDMVSNNITGDEPYTAIQDKVRLEWVEFKRTSSDVVPRSFIRHDPAKLAEIIVNL